MSVITTTQEAREEIEYAIRAYEAGKATPQMMVARIRQVLTFIDLTNQQNKNDT